MTKIRVLVIDDSPYNRRTISKILGDLPEIEVIGYATDGEEGIRKAIDLHPDLITLDLEMPKMDGFTFLRIVMSRCPTPVLVISSRSDREGVFKALELGAADFVVKPAANATAELASIADELRGKVRSLVNLNLKGIVSRGVKPAAAVSPAPAQERKPAAAPPAGKRRVEVVAIGSSTGGPPALQNIFNAFPDRVPLAVVVSQHMPPKFTKSFAERLNRSSSFDIREAKDGDRVREGRILIAPGGKNMVFERTGEEVVARIVEPSAEDKYIPSVDVMLESCAAMFGSKLLAVVLTGMGNDGARGVRAVKARGGQIIAESEETAVVFGMPREAIATGAVDGVVRLENVAREIMQRSGLASDFDDRS